MPEGEARRTLVTGGAGFLGSHLCERLLKRGEHVICVDDESTGTRRNIAHLMAHPRFEYVQHDIITPIHVEVDQIYNLASPASPVHFQRDPIRTVKTNVYGAINMLDLAKRTNATMLQASTSEVYGDPDMHPQGEEYWGNVNPIGPRACYDEGKRAAETLTFDYHRQYGVRIKVARIFNTYGPRMQAEDGRVVSTFIAQALRGDPLTVHGDGSHSRSFCYVDDLIDGLTRLMDSPNDVTGPINLGNPTEITVLELAKQVIALTNSSSLITFLPLPEDDPRRREPRIIRAWNRLQWSPTTPLLDGLAKTIAWHNEPHPAAGPA